MWWRARIDRILTRRKRQVLRLVLDSREILVLNSPSYGPTVLEAAIPVSRKFDLLDELQRKRNTRIVLTVRVVLALRKCGESGQRCSRL
mmetsp:Transcript_28976/g.38479  ORF Transcript_28976/g.38479 Transcript_28976/m.38479 type:complete len:89 (-) Transcript_28976:22-288(-)